MSNVVAIDHSAQLEVRKEEARILACSALMPQQYQGESGRANCLIAIEIAQRIGASPLMVAQNLHVIHGRPSWSSSFLIAAINASGRFSKPLRYEERNPGEDSWSMRAYTFDHDNDRVDGPWVGMAMAQAEGWATKKGSKWLTMPELMLRYRAAAFFARTTCPELTMGLLTSEEATDIQAPVVVEATTSRDALEQALGMAPEPELVTESEADVAEDGNAVADDDSDLGNIPA